MSKTITTAQAVALMRSQRHSLSNHLQVISGWLQLGNRERAMVQVQRLVERMEAEGHVVRQLDSPDVALFVMAANLQAEVYGVAVEWQVVGPVDPAELESGNQRLTAALERLAALPAQQRRLVVRLQMPIAVHSSATEGEG